jgi:hypothetical protein
MASVAGNPRVPDPSRSPLKRDMIRTVLVYLDMCCLKRPFDDQSQPRIRLETEAVLNLLAVEPETVQFVRSAALLLENELNPVRERAARVEQWLKAAPLWTATDDSALQQRVDQFRQAGMKSFDALHLASAEQAGAALFVTTDDRLLTAATRQSDLRRTRACSLLNCAKELIQ